MKKIAIFLLFALISFLSCKKEEKSAVAKMLTNGPWILAQTFFDDDGDGILSDISQSCQSDDTWTFNTDESMAINDMDDWCEPDFGPFSFSGYWDLSNNDKTLLIVLSQGFTQDSYNITSISNEELILDSIDPDNPAAPPTDRFVLRR